MNDETNPNQAAPVPDEPGSRTRYIPASDWNKYHPWPPAGGLRHLIFHADKNGFGSCFRKIGSRVLIDEAAFFRWVDSHQHAPEKRPAKPMKPSAKPKAQPWGKTLCGSARREIEDAIDAGAIGGDDDE